jgi:outer membrane receptor protein involved in Fe transport
VSTTDPLTGKIGAQLNIESIQEIEIKTSGATAEFGRAQGGFANIITKAEL